jgi:hypothetical protein
MRMPAPFSRLAAAGFVLLASLASPAFAREATPVEVTALEQTVTNFDNAMTKNDLDTIVGTIPPRLQETLAKQANIDVDTLHKSIVAQMQAALATVKITAFSMDVKGADQHELADGTPYFLIPTTTEMDLNGSKSEAQSRTLALLDGDKWYLLRIDDAAQIALLRTVYPQFADVDFEPGTLKAVKP